MTEPEIEIRRLQPLEDLPAIRRLWREVGWVDEDDDKHVDTFFSVGSTLLATMDGEPECAVHTVPGTLRLQKEDLPLCAVTAVTTSRIARGQAFAKTLTAQQLQQAANDGAAVAALGMFDQGFYEQVGFGTGGYDHQFAFDPSTLKVDHKVPAPKRLGKKDFVAIHGALVKRKKVHGSVVLDPPELIKAELNWAPKGFGLGYFDGDELTHFLWLGDSGEHGPYRVELMAYQTTEQLVMLLGVLKSLGDQVYLVKMTEPPEIQLQDLLDRPFRNQFRSTNGKYAADHYSSAWWQLRILDLPKCVSALHCSASSLRFGLRITDPVEPLLNSAEGWVGQGGDYVVSFGKKSSAVQGVENDLPLLTCTINAFTRLLWGVAGAVSLSITDELHGPEELLAQLDEIVQLPTPHAGFDF